MTVATLGLDELLYTREGFRGGRPCLASTRLTVHSVIAQHLLDRTPGELLEDFPTATLAGIHSALAYFYAHREQILAEFEDDARVGLELVAAQEHAWDARAKQRA